MPIIVVRCLGRPVPETAFAPRGPARGGSPPAGPWGGVPEDDLAPHLRRLPVLTVSGLEVRVARGLRARLVGLAWTERAAAGEGLLIPRCSSVHTFGMRFALDLHFLDREGCVVAVRLAVPPKRFAFCGGASAVLELPAAAGGENGAALA